MPKGLSIDTLLPTPTGWTSVHDLKVGDILFDEVGYACQVTKVSEPFIGKSLAVSIGWGMKGSPESTKMVVGTEQQFITIGHRRMDKWKRPDLDTKTLLPHFTGLPEDWVTWSRANLPRESKRGRKPRISYAQPITATEAQATTIYRHNKGSGNYLEYLNHHIPTTFALKLPDHKLPLDPYLMGLLISHWNWERSCYEKGRAKIPDTFACTSRMFGYYEKEFTQRGWTFVPDAQVKGKVGDNYGRILDCTIDGMPEFLAQFGFEYGKSNHIPELYMRGSIHQREELLAGMMDRHRIPIPQGSMNATFGTDNPRMQREFTELVRSLGYPAFIKEIVTELEDRPDLPHIRWFIQWYPMKSPYKFKKYQARYLCTRIVGSDLTRYMWRFYKFEDNGDAMMRTVEVNSKFGLFSASEYFLPVLGGSNQ